MKRKQVRKQVSLKASAELIKKAKLLAVAQDRSLNSVFAEALQDLLKKYEKEIPRTKTPERGAKTGNDREAAQARLDAGEGV